MTESKLKLIKKYYSIQDSTLKSLKKLNDVVQEIINYDDDNVYYMFRYHGYRYGKKTYKYIQSHFKSRPQITTDQGYAARCNILFKTREDALRFFRKFMTSKSRRYTYDIDSWKLVEKTVDDYKVIERYDDEYGSYFVG